MPILTECRRPFRVEVVEGFVQVFFGRTSTLALRALDFRVPQCLRVGLPPCRVNGAEGRLARGGREGVAEGRLPTRAEGDLGRKGGGTPVRRQYLQGMSHR